MLYAPCLSKHLKSGPRRLCTTSTPTNRRSRERRSSKAPGPHPGPLQSCPRMCSSLPCWFPVLQSKKVRCQSVRAWCHCVGESVEYILGPFSELEGVSVNAWCLLNEKKIVTVRCFVRPIRRKNCWLNAWAVLKEERS